MRKQNKKPNIIAPLIILIISILIGVISYLIFGDAQNSAIAFLASLVLISLYLFIKEKLRISAEIKKMEEVFPDFIELMSSNLRAGMTIDKALLLSSRKEFAPLDREITMLGKDIVTGKEISKALSEMALRIGSEKIRKTIDLITSGIKSGGNISILLEETAVNMRERSFIEKRPASNVLMYVIFIFFAVAVGAPLLFGLSSALVQILTNLLATIPTGEMPTNTPFTMTKITISVSFVTYLSLMFLIATSILASMIIGLVNKGEEKSGVKYALPLIAISTVVFFAIKTLMIKYFAGFFG
jgi:archaeal flagellar protein FlaJ